MVSQGHLWPLGPAEHSPDTDPVQGVGHQVVNPVSQHSAAQVLSPGNLFSFTCSHGAPGEFEFGGSSCCTPGYGQAGAGVGHHLEVGDGSQRIRPGRGGDPGAFPGAEEHGQGNHVLGVGGQAAELVGRHRLVEGQVTRTVLAKEFWCWTPGHPVASGSRD